MKNISLICYWHSVEKILAPADDKLFCFHFQFSLLVLQSCRDHEKSLRRLKFVYFVVAATCKKWRQSYNENVNVRSWWRIAKLNEKLFFGQFQFVFWKGRAEHQMQPIQKLPTNCKISFLAPKEKLFKFSTKDQLKIKVLPWYIPDILTEVSQPETLH